MKAPGMQARTRARRARRRETGRILAGRSRGRRRVTGSRPHGAAPSSSARSSMSRPGFVHLRTHSEYSIVDSTLRIDDAVAAAAADRMPALALTDLGNQFGLVKFYQAARARGIKPIAGCDAWIAGEGE